MRSMIRRALSSLKNIEGSRHFLPVFVYQTKLQGNMYIHCCTLQEGTVEPYWLSAIDWQGHFRGHFKFCAWESK